MLDGKFYIFLVSTMMNVSIILLHKKREKTLDRWC